MPHIYYRYNFSNGPDKTWQSFQVTNEQYAQFHDMQYDDMYYEIVENLELIPSGAYRMLDTYRGVEISLINPMLNANKLILLRGLPGSGKSSMAQFLSMSLPSCVYFESDMARIDETGIYKFDPNDMPRTHSWCIRQVEVAMKDFNYDTVIVSNTFTENWEMRPYIELARQYNYQVVTMIVENNHGHKNTKNVPRDTLNAMRERFQVNL